MNLSPLASKYFNDAKIARISGDSSRVTSEVLRGYLFTSYAFWKIAQRSLVSYLCSSFSLPSAPFSFFDFSQCRCEDDDRSFKSCNIPHEMFHNEIRTNLIFSHFCQQNSSVLMRFAGLSMRFDGSIDACLSSWVMGDNRDELNTLKLSGFTRILSNNFFL